ncbi:hypothetical protein AB8B02_08680 [Tardiphaga sp. 862_B3_N4_1]|uniref:hypothetical protein n=1 Tax=Tardiphaga sp. 862_B3_N4_1 TaxID=3240764 RepID=UPI003F287A67
MEDRKENREEGVSRRTSSGLDRSRAEKHEDAGEAEYPTRLIATKLERTVTSVYGKATREGISLAPTNRSPRDYRKVPQRNKTARPGMTLGGM